LLASGSDSGEFCIWDLRQFSTTKPQSAATFNWHKSQITCIDWNPFDSSVLIVSGSDDQTTIWDLSLECDEEEVLNGLENVPGQLLFVHQGQDNVKEVMWHRQIKGLVVNTAYDGFNLFKTFNQ
jgi:ribosome assembly protein RRB1